MVPGIITPGVLWEQRHDVIEVSNSIVIPLCRCLALDVVRDVRVAEFGQPERVLDSVSECTLHQYLYKCLTISTLIPLFRSVVPSKADTAPPRL